MKMYHSYILKQFGINTLIAIKAQMNYATDTTGTLYRRLPAYSFYKYSKEDVFNDLHFHFSMVKEFAQYQ